MRIRIQSRVRSTETSEIYTWGGGAEGERGRLGWGEEGEGDAGVIVSHSGSSCFRFVLFRFTHAYAFVLLLPYLFI